MDEVHPKMQYYNTVLQCSGEDDTELMNTKKNNVDVNVAFYKARKALCVLVQLIKHAQLYVQWYQ